MPSNQQPRPEAQSIELLSILAANVRRLRAESRWSTRAFAEDAGLSLSSLYGIEHGTQKTVRLSTVCSIAKAFGVHISVLLTQDANNRTPWTGEDSFELLARNLTTKRKLAGFTQEELAERSGVARDIVAKIERQRRNPTLQILERLVIALGGSAADLLAPNDSSSEVT